MSDDWVSNAKYVLLELKRLNDKIESLDEKIDGMCNDFTELKTEFKVKSGLFGAIGASIPIGIMLALKLLGQ